MRRVLERDYGISIGLSRVFRLMQKAKLVKISRKNRPKFTYFVDLLTKEDNLLDQNFNQTAPNKVWAGDFTYIKLGTRWVYLAVVMDLFSRRILSWKLSVSLTSDFVIEAFKEAYKKRGCPDGLMFHADRGTQYTSFEFRQLLEKLQVTQSYSLKATPYDNAVIESYLLKAILSI